MKFEIWPDGAIKRLGAVAKDLHQIGVTETDAMRVLAVAAASEGVEEDDRPHLARAVIDDVGLWEAPPNPSPSVTQAQAERRQSPSDASAGTGATPPAKPHTREEKLSILRDARDAIDQVLGDLS